MHCFWSVTKLLRSPSDPSHSKSLSKIKAYTGAETARCFCNCHRDESGASKTVQIILDIINLWMKYFLIVKQKFWDHCDFGRRRHWADWGFVNLLSLSRWTSVLALSHTTSETASFWSICNECSRTDRKGISCGVSTTCRRMDGQRPSERLSQLHPVLKK